MTEVDYLNLIHELSQRLLEVTTELEELKKKLPQAVDSTAHAQAD